MIQPNRPEYPFRLKSRPDESRGNAIEILLALFVAEEFDLDDIDEVIVTHQPRCRLQRDRGACDCNPSFDFILSRTASWKLP